MDKLLINIFLVLSMSILLYFIVFLALTSEQIKYFGIKKRVNKLVKMSDLSDFNSTGDRSNQKAKGFFAFIKVSNSFRKDMLTSGLSFRPEEFVVFWFFCTILPPLIYSLFNGFGMRSFIVLIMGFIFPILLLNISKKRRITKFNLQLNEALVIISNSLRTGFTFRYALARVAEDLPNPISFELKRVIREVNYGAKIEDSLGELAERMNSKELGMINSAVMIQQRTGGNLAEIIEKVSQTISDRIKLANQIKALTAQGKMSGIIMGLLPAAICLILYFISPGYMDAFFTHPLGVIVLIFCIVWEIMGFLFIQKIVDIKF